MSEFKYACPVCGQHMMCDSSQSGSVMECPTCFQKITAPHAPAGDDQKLIITGTKVGNGRPTPKIPEGNSIFAPKAKSFPGITVVLIILVCIAAAVGFVYRGTIFKAGGGQTNQVAVTPELKPPPAPVPQPITGPAVVIFSKGDSFLIGSTNDIPMSDSAKAAFLGAFKADLARPSGFAGPDKLTNLPVYGRTVAGAGGEIQWQNSFAGGLVIGVTLEGLLPNHAYILTINGSPGRAGNDKLTETVDPKKAEKYYDFSTITTDATGHFHTTFGIRLPASPYDVHFYVKDTTDFKIVLYHDFFQFTVE